MKDKKCCNVEVTETEKGFRVEILGDKVKECLASLLKCCAAQVKRGCKERA